MNSSDPIQQKTRVKEIMNSFVVSVDSLVTANDAAKILEDTGVGAMIVLDFRPNFEKYTILVICNVFY